MVKRLNQYKTDFKYDVATFRNRAMALLVDISEQSRLKEAKSHSINEQKQICDHLHLELEVCYFNSLNCFAELCLFSC